MPATSPTVWRILLVDDDPLVCDSVRRMLEFDRRNVHVATGGNEALALCEKETFDLVILDYLMPGMKGDTLAATLKQRYPHQPIIMITADAERLSETNEKPAGVDLLVAKPFRLDDLREAVSKVLLKN